MSGTIIKVIHKIISAGSGGGSRPVPDLYLTDNSGVILTNNSGDPLTV